MSPVSCFLAGTLIQTDKGPVPVEQLRAGNRVFTMKHGYRTVVLTGSKALDHRVGAVRHKDLLYVYRASQIPELTRDLVLTGCHSVLVERFEGAQQEWTVDVLGDLYLTDGLFRLPACVDKRSDLYDVEGPAVVYHFALEHPDPHMNYGVFANGMLVESSSEDFLRNHSGMELTYPL